MKAQANNEDQWHIWMATDDVHLIDLYEHYAIVRDGDSPNEVYNTPLKRWEKLGAEPDTLEELLNFYKRSCRTNPIKPRLRPCRLLAPAEAIGKVPADQLVDLSTVQFH